MATSYPNMTAVTEPDVDTPNESENASGRDPLGENLDICPVEQVMVGEENSPLPSVDTEPDAEMDPLDLGDTSKTTVCNAPSGPVGLLSMNIILGIISG